MARSKLRIEVVLYNPFASPFNAFSERGIKFKYLSAKLLLLVRSPANGGAGTLVPLAVKAMLLVSQK